ncbi:hypothetical protein [Polyangium spumosum]|uniref:Uncharacterized protein n=1 Tax=Polyangium spumosum TaxID=889282 RepID=A0A6N7PE35_9BACT|nr:hypothetical protein [Polyangium spumosum]MRG90322.1 hypothetical protein [Polyangium spumosum]
MKVGEDDGDEGPEDDLDPVLEAVRRAPLVPATEEELALLEEAEREGPASWKLLLPLQEGSTPRFVRGRRG